MSAVLSVNVGRPRLKQWRGRTISTAIFKAPVEGRVMARVEGLDGDQQADRNVHGGPDKAVYVYQAEHYEPWKGELAVDALPWSAFGENLTCSGGWPEDEVRIGDRFRIGGAEFEVSQPRLPCGKLNLRFERPDMVKRMLANGRFGFYLRVLGEGEVGASDEVERVGRSAWDFTVAEAARIAAIDKDDLDLLRRAVAVEALPGPWLQGFRRRLTMRERGEEPGDE